MREFYFGSKHHAHLIERRDGEFTVRRKNSGSRMTPESINKEATVEGRLCGDLRSFDLAQDRFAPKKIWTPDNEFLGTPLCSVKAGDFGVSR